MNTGIATPGINTQKTSQTSETPQMDKVCNETGKRLGGYFGPDGHDPRASLLKGSEAGNENSKFNDPYFKRHPESD